MGATTGAEVEERLRAALSPHSGLVCAYLFGSVARSEAGPRSDVDVAVLFERTPGSRLDAGPLDLEGDLERALGREVQLVVLNRAPADLVHRVLRDGRLVLERDPAARIRFEVARRNEYFDLEPIRRRYRAGRRPPTDTALVTQRRARIGTSCRELRELARPDRMRSDVRERRFVEHTLQIAIQAVLDVASHIVSDERLGEPETNRALFPLLESAGWIDAELSASLQRMAGFRNVLVHGYADVDLDIVADAARAGLADLESFVAAVRGR